MGFTGLDQKDQNFYDIGRVYSQRGDSTFAASTHVTLLINVLMPTLLAKNRQTGETCRGASLNLEVWTMNNFLSSMKYHLCYLIKSRFMGLAADLVDRLMN